MFAQRARNVGIGDFARKGNGLVGAQAFHRLLQRGPLGALTSDSPMERNPSGAQASQDVWKKVNAFLFAVHSAQVKDSERAGEVAHRHGVFIGNWDAQGEIAHGHTGEFRQLGNFLADGFGHHGQEIEMRGVMTKGLINLRIVGMSHGETKDAGGHVAQDFKRGHRQIGQDCGRLELAETLEDELEPVLENKLALIERKHGNIQSFEIRGQRVVLFEAEGFDGQVSSDQFTAEIAEEGSGAAKAQSAADQRQAQGGGHGRILSHVASLLQREAWFQGWRVRQDLNLQPSDPKSEALSN